MRRALPVLLVVFAALASAPAASAQRTRRDAGVPGGPDAGASGRPDAGRPDGSAGPDPATMDRARALFARGQAAYAEGRFDEAATRMAEAWELTRAPELAFNTARAYERMSDYANALRFFDTYLAGGSVSAEDRAAVEARMTAIREAQARRDQQVFSAPASTDELTTEARTFFLRGVSMFRRRQYQAAQTAFLAAYRFSPLPEVIFNLAVTSERLEARQDAIDYYREYLRARPDSPDRGDVEARVRRLREAR